MDASLYKFKTSISCFSNCPFTRVLVFSLFLIVLLSGHANAQSEKKIQKWFLEAKQSYRQEEFIESIEYCDKIVNANPNFVDAHLLLADIYNQIDSTQLEIFHLLEAKRNSTIALIVFRIAEAYFYKASYSEALEYYNEYLSLNGVSETRKKEVYRRIACCNFASAAMKEPIVFNPERISDNVNSGDDEYWPGISLDNKFLVFTRLAKDSLQIPQEDFFIAKLDSSGWGPAKPIEEINTRGNEGAQCISADGRILFFTACNRSDGFGSCDIYYSIFINGKWSTPQNAGAPLNSQAWEAQPSFSSDNRYLYFSSDRINGEGKKDIWRSELLGCSDTDELVWSKPENLGELVNTPGDDISPFIHPNNENFYFISDSHVGMGGFDIYKCNIRFDTIFSDPQNLGYPINTIKNEQGLVISADGSTGYFSSSRNEKTGMDIYRFELDEKIRPRPVTYIKLKVYDNSTEQPLQCNIDLINLSLEEQANRTATTDSNGELLLCLPLGADYAFNVSKQGYLFYSESFLLASPKSIAEPLDLTLRLDPVMIGAEMNLYNIYFDIDSYEILEESEPELRRLTAFMEKNASLKIEIQGHTDSSGDSDKNQRLSENRANAVVDYLTEAGIEKSRMSAKGFGDKIPVSTNKTADGRRKNRRTTIKIVGI